MSNLPYPQQKLDDAFEYVDGFLGQSFAQKDDKHPTRHEDGDKKGNAQAMREHSTGRINQALQQILSPRLFDEPGEGVGNSTSQPWATQQTANQGLNMNSDLTVQSENPNELRQVSAERSPGLENPPGDDVRPDPQNTSWRSSRQAGGNGDEAAVGTTGTCASSGPEAFPTSNQDLQQVGFASQDPNEPPMPAYDLFQDTFDWAEFENIPGPLDIAELPDPELLDPEHTNVATSGSWNPIDEPAFDDQTNPSHLSQPPNQSYPPDPGHFQTQHSQANQPQPFLNQPPDPEANQNQPPLDFSQQGDAAAIPRFNSPQLGPPDAGEARIISEAVALSAGSIGGSRQSGRDDQQLCYRSLDEVSSLIYAQHNMVEDDDHGKIKGSRRLQRMFMRGILKAMEDPGWPEAIVAGGSATAEERDSWTAWQRRNSDRIRFESDGGTAVCEHEIRRRTELNCWQLLRWIVNAHEFGLINPGQGASLLHMRCSVRILLCTRVIKELKIVGLDVKNGRMLSNLICDPVDHGRRKVNNLWSNQRKALRNQAAFGVSPREPREVGQKKRKTYQEEEEVPRRIFNVSDLLGPGPIVTIGRKRKASAVVSSSDAGVKD